MTVHEEFRQRRVKLLLGVLVSFVVFGLAGWLGERFHSAVFIPLVF